MSKISDKATEDLHRRLVDAKLAGTRTSVENDHEYHFHSNEQAAELAVAIMLDWMDDLSKFKIGDKVVVDDGDDEGRGRSGVIVAGPDAEGMYQVDVDGAFPVTRAEEEIELGRQGDLEG